MISVRRWSIRMRIMLVGTIPVLLAALLLTSYHMIKRWSEMQRETDVLTTIALENLVASSEYPIFTGNYSLLTPVVNTILKQPAIVAVEILDEDDQRLFYQQTSRYQEIPHQDIRRVEQQITQEVPSLDAFNEFDGAQMMVESLGTVRLEVADTFNLQRQDALMSQSLLAGFGIVVVSMIVAGAISTTIIPPLERLTGFMGQLSSGDPSERIKVDNGAEIGDLQKSANQLAHSLQQAQQSQARYTARLKQEQQKSQQASQAKSEFLAMMSHELRTPLNGASGMLQLLNPATSQADFIEYHQSASQSLSNLSQILEDILIVVDTEKNNLPVAFEEQLLPEVLQEMLNDFSKQALEQRLSFVVEFDDSLQRNHIRIDPSLIRQVVRHLVDNALKFTHQGYVIVRFSLHPQLDHHWLMLQVLDSGIGIPAGKRHLVMEAFQQASSSFNREYDGMGVGLTISNHICHVLGGGLRLFDNDGGGTRVDVSLPVETSIVTAESPAKELPQQINVLVVEDNAVNLKVAQKMIARVCPGAIVDAAPSGERCLEMVADKAYDMILMDCQMPGIDGFETTNRLRSMGVDCPIVACTANGSEEVYKRCISAGMNGYMGKPVSIDTMKSTMFKWLAVSPGPVPDPGDTTS